MSLPSHPCGSCPYRRDVPSGVWAAEEYAKLPDYDGPIYTQPPAAFFCHQADGELCRGWVGCHDMEENLGLRMAAFTGVLTPEQVEEARDYVCPVPLFTSGQEAADHGTAEIEEPGVKARKVVAKLAKKLDTGA